MGKSLIEVYSSNLRIYIYSNKLALCLIIWLNAFLLVWNIILHLILLWSFSILVNSHVLLVISKSYFSCIVALLPPTCLHLCTNSKDHQDMTHWPILHYVVAKYGSFTTFQVVGTPLRDNFTLHWVSSHRHHSLPVLLLPRGVQRGFLPLALHVPQYLHQFQPKLIWKMHLMHSLWGASFLPLWHISKLFPTLVLSSWT